MSLENRGAATEAAGDGSSGSRSLVVAAVSVFVIRGDRLLALKRSLRKKAAPGAWDVVSGRVEPGEHPYDAAVRECREESGLDVTPDRSPVAAYAAQRRDKPMLVVAYRAESASGDVVISHEHDDHAWMTIDEFARACPFPLLVDTARQAMARGGATSVADSAYVILWEFRVRPGSEPAFEAAYGSSGDWAVLFRRAPGYLGTELLRAPEAGRYVTIDRWVSRAAFEAFREAYRADYDDLDRRSAGLTIAETPLGKFDHAPGKPAPDKPAPDGAGAIKRGSTTD
jgi:8-oxo-dGTP diphosphatase